MLSEEESIIEVDVRVLQVDGGLGNMIGEIMTENIEVSGTHRMIDILRLHGIEMEVQGCGCCGSPYVLFKYLGETIVDGEDINFNSGSDVNMDAGLFVHDSRKTS